MPNATDLTKGIVITTAGNVGIGVASPTGKLEVAGTVSVL